MEELIVGPLEATQIRTLIIIDALDECKDEEPASAILSILSRYVDQIPSAKFFITGRPEPRILLGFRLLALQPVTEVLRLHDVKRPLVNVDIKLFLRTYLADIAIGRINWDLAGDWPSSSDIDVLCEKAAGLLSTRQLSSNSWHPGIIDPRRGSLSWSHSHKAPLTKGSPELTLSMPSSEASVSYLGSDHQKQGNQEVYRRLKSVVGAVLLVFNPLSIQSLSELLDDFDSPSDISTSLDSLHSLLLIPEDPEDPIRVFHKSLPDFLTDSKRCQDARFFVDPPVHHTEILLSCLNLMDKRLKRDICNLGSYAIPSKVDDPTGRRKEHVGDGLEYACRFWTKHLVESPNDGSSAEKVQKVIDKFFTTHLLSWIEVLILTGNLNAAVYSINDIQQWYTSVSYGQSFVKAYTYPLFRQTLHASGQMMASVSSWNTLTQSPTLLSGVSLCPPILPLLILAS